MASAAENRRGIIFMLVAMSLFVVNDTFMKLAREVYPAGQAIALRTCFAVLVGFVLVFAAREGDRLRLAFRPRVLQRGMLEAFGALTFGWSLGLMPLANITAINMASPLLIVALAVVLGMERVGWRRTVALTVGFIGVLFVVRPGAARRGMSPTVAESGVAEKRMPAGVRGEHVSPIGQPPSSRARSPPSELHARIGNAMATRLATSAARRHHGRREEERSDRMRTSWVGRR